jgi:hypothetical protein
MNADKKARVIRIGGDSHRSPARVVALRRYAALASSRNRSAVSIRPYFRVLCALGESVPLFMRTSIKGFLAACYANI